LSYTRTTRLLLLYYNSTSYCTKKGVVGSSDVEPICL